MVKYPWLVGCEAQTNQCEYKIKAKERTYYCATYEIETDHEKFLQWLQLYKVVIQLQIKAHREEKCNRKAKKQSKTMTEDDRRTFKAPGRKGRTFRQVVKDRGRMN